MGWEQWLVVGEVGDRRGHNDLIDRGDDLCVVTLNPAALGRHHRAIRIADVDPPVGIGCRRLGLAATHPLAGGLLPSRPLGDLAFVGLLLGVILGLQPGLGIQQPAAPRGLSTAQPRCLTGR